jgi:hypothetical protein
MQRDPLCIEFDEVLSKLLRGNTNQTLRDKRDELEQKVREKWQVHIDVLESQTAIGRKLETDPKNPALKCYNKEYFVGPFKWWCIAGEPHRTEEDARQGGRIVINDGKMNSYSFEDNGLVYCEPHKIPIIIDPTVITVHDVKKVKEEVWAIVEKELKAKKRNESSDKISRRNKWNPAIIPGESTELSKILRSKEKVFKKYLEWYDMICKGLPFRTLAALELWNPTQEKKQEAFEKVLTSNRNQKIREKIKGESNVRNGYNMIYFAVHRKYPPKQIQNADCAVVTSKDRYNCPVHGNKCPLEWSYLNKWYKKEIDKEFTDSALTGLTADADKKLLQKSRTLPKKAEY